MEGAGRGVNYCGFGFWKVRNKLKLTFLPKTEVVLRYLSSLKNPTYC